MGIRLPAAWSACLSTVTRNCVERLGQGWFAQRLEESAELSSLDLMTLETDGVVFPKSSTLQRENHPLSALRKLPRNIPARDNFFFALMTSQSRILYRHLLGATFRVSVGYFLDRKFIVRWGQLR